MPLKVGFKFDDSITLEWDCAGIKPFIESIAFLHELPRVCPVERCGAPLHFFFRSPQGNSYYGLACEGSPAHEVNFGQHKEGGTLYYKGDGAWEIAYKDRQGGESGPSPAQPGQAAPSQPQGQPAPAATTSPKADITVINMIGAVARAKKVGDLDALSKQMLSKPVAELDADGAAALLEYLKTL